MASSSSKPALKQKTLLGFFNKTSSSTASPLAAKETQLKARTQSKSTKNIEDAPTSKIATTNKDNDAKMKSKRISNATSTKGVSKVSESSSPARTFIQTPPTSDPIDLSMLSDLTDDERGVVPIKKRKKAVVDSDEDIIEVDKSFKRPSDAHASDLSNGKDFSTSRSKRARTSSFSVNDEDSEAEERSRSFSDKLAEFRKARSSGKRRLSSSSVSYAISDEEDAEAVFKKPAHKVRSQSRASSTGSRKSRSSTDDDDFIAHSDSEISYSAVIDSEVEELPKKSKYKAADDSETKKKRPTAKGKGKGNSGQGSGENFLLTAAEQRALEKKTDKKDKEEAFPFLQDIRDKDKNRPGDPDYDPRTLYVPPNAWKIFTPFEKQFWEIKQNHYDTILFFQKGKFLELYEDDARVGNRLFDLKLTQRVKMSMVGVPEMSFSFWAAKFLAKGYKVGRVDQAETALGAEMRRTADNKSGGDKLVRRVLNKVFTNGTLVDGDLLMDDEASHCVSIRESSDGKTFGICVLDSATSQFDLTFFEDDICRTKLETTMRQLRPKEIIFTKGNLGIMTTRLFRNILDGSCLWTHLRPSEGLGYDRTIDELKIMFPDEENDMEEGQGIPEVIRGMLSDTEAIEALGAMIWYLRQLNIDKDLLSMKNFNIYDPLKQGKGLVLDGQTLAHIEVLVNSEGSYEGTLLSLLGRCITPFGKRLFRLWLCMPLRDVKQIQERQDAVQDLIEHLNFEADFTRLVKGIPDLERVVSRIHAKNCKVKDFLKVLECFKRLNKGLVKLGEVAESFSSNSIQGLLRSAPDLRTYLDNIEEMFQMPKDGPVDHLLPCEGKDEKYDEIQERIQNLETKLDDELNQLEKKHKMKLKYWHSAQGTKEIYQVETSSTQKDIPKNWTKTANTKAVKRWSVPVLAPTIRELQMAREERNSAIKEYKYRIFAEFDSDRVVWLRMVKTVAELDCLLSLAKSSVAIGEPACRPTFVESEFAFVDFEELRHPALNLKGDFIPNDVRLGGSVGRIALLTGPNMAGKSTMMRMTAAGIIMAQLGMLVPARAARISPVDAILTRMGAYDNMFSNSSTFKVELDECCKILRNATPKSLVILDELGRGTSTYDGMAIAEAVLHHLATHTLALSCFATHYSSLTDDFAHHPNIRNMHMQTLVDDEKRELLFLYKLIEGVATGSFGTHVANLAGVPIDVVTRAEVISKDFANKFNEKQAQKKEANNIPIIIQADFAYLAKVANGDVQLDPTKAAETLRILKQFVKNQPL